MSRWFRHYAGMMRDDKLVSVAIRSKQTVERVVWVWGAILESAAEIDDNGRFDVDAAEISYFLRADEADIHAVLAGLEGTGRVALGVVVKWGDRQFQSDKSAARQAAYRERKRAKNAGGDDSQASGDEGVTSLSRHGNAPETETETEEDSVEPDGSTGAAAPSAIDLRAAVFSSGVPLLIAGGLTERNARSMLGRWRSDHGDGPVLDALATAQGRGPSEAVPYIRRTLERKNGHSVRGVGTDPLLADYRRAVEEERAGLDQETDPGDWPPISAAGAGSA